MKTNRLNHDDLHPCSWVFCSDDDCPVVNDIYVGFDRALRLIAIIEHSDYDEPQYNCATYAVLSKDEAYRLARRLKVAMTDLPSLISASMGEYDQIINPTLKQVVECFDELLERFIDEGCKFRIIRQPAEDGFCCC